jgi:hypothetical protein
MLGLNNTEADWFRLAASRSSCICFTNDRLRFWNDAGDTKSNPVQGHVLFYFGPDRERFKRAFAGIGYFARFEA